MSKVFQQTKTVIVNWTELKKIMNVKYKVLKKDLKNPKTFQNVSAKDL